MTTLTGANTRTITGYLVTLLEYPRWLIEREVDFSGCHLAGNFADDDDHCDICHFGSACNWLNNNRSEPTLETPLPDLVNALRSAADYLRAATRELSAHAKDCDCDTCQWLREANNFLRIHRHRT